jgi:hypothetical protein
MDTLVELTPSELEAVAGGNEKQPPGSGEHPYDREAKCIRCKALTWWDSGKETPKACPYCGGPWAYIRTGRF